MANSKPLPKKLDERRKVLDKRIEMLESLQVPTLLNGADMPVVGDNGLLLQKFSQYERSRKRNVRAAVAIAATLIAGAVYINRDKVTEAVVDTPSSVSVGSKIPLIDSAGNGVVDAVSYELSTTTQTRQLVDGAGKALLVQISIDTSDTYPTSTFGKTSQVCMPQSTEAVQKGCQPLSTNNQCVAEAAVTESIYCLPPGELSADALFAKFGTLKGTDNAWLCPSEVAAIVNEIKTNADIFDNETFSKEEITSATTLHETSYEPYTKVPKPALHNDIILIAGDVQLVC